METQQQRSGWAAGWATFAAAMLGLIGMFQILTGIAGLANDEFYLESPNFVFDFDATAWGWIHLLLGIILMASAVGIMVGNVAARTVGVIVALISAITNFGFIPMYPVYAIVMIAVNITVIWSLTAHGRDVTMD